MGIEKGEYLSMLDIRSGENGAALRCKTEKKLFSLSPPSSEMVLAASTDRSMSFFDLRMLHRPCAQVNFNLLGCTEVKQAKWSGKGGKTWARALFLP